ncbi:MAG: FAD-binding protein [Arenicellales bacterium]
MFRYRRQAEENQTVVSLSEFNHLLSTDKQEKLLDTEALITFEQLVSHTLKHGFLPTVAPELKHITLAGATAGIGIESSCFRYGFVHDGVLEVDVLLPDGRILTCRENNEYADLFYGMANSYGTLGYVLRAKIKLIPSKSFVQIDNHRYDSVL